LALAAQISVPLPFTPIPLVMTPFALFMIALTLGSRKGVAAVFAYLLQGSLGLPVFAGGQINPAWLMSPRAGYLVGFMLAVWAIGSLKEYYESRYKALNFTQIFASLLLGEVLILTCGASVLALFVGVSHSLALGVLPFILGDVAAILLAALIFRPLAQFMPKL